jgi:DNA-binding XRE family transcriptional regulator
MTEPVRFPTVQQDGATTHVLVPIEEFQRLSAGRAGGAERVRGGGPPAPEAIAEAIQIYTDPDTEWHDAEAAFWEILRGGIGRLRRERGLTQQQLAEALGVSQPHVSRLEANIDTATLQVLRRVAAVLSDQDDRQKKAG